VAPHRGGGVANHLRDLATFHSSVPIALYIFVLAIIGIISTALLTDYTGKDISAEYSGPLLSRAETGKRLGWPLCGDTDPTLR
jgi:hypothetical protein